MKSLAWALSLFAIQFSASAAQAADPVGDCYAAATASYGGQMAFRVKAGGEVVFETSSLGLFMDKVAELSSDPTMVLQPNPAGRLALNSTTSCLWGQDVITLSSMELLNHYDAVLDITTTNSTTELDFDKFGVPCSGPAADALVFTDGQSTASIQVASYGPNDYWGTLSVSPDLSFCENFGSCGGKCEGFSMPNGSNECECTLVGTCQPIHTYPQGPKIRDRI